MFACADTIHVSLRTVEERYFSRLKIDHAGSAIHPAVYSMGTEFFPPEGKASRA